jgi:hypothetical protein
LAAGSVPIAQPTMISSSAGRLSAMIRPFSTRNPASINPNTTTMPKMANMLALPSADVILFLPVPSLFGKQRSPSRQRIFVTDCLNRL